MSEQQGPDAVAGIVEQFDHVCLVAVAYGAASAESEEGAAERLAVDKAAFVAFLTALVRERDAMKPVVEAARELRIARSAHNRALDADEITFTRAKDRYFAAEEALIVALIPLVGLDDIDATAPPDGK